MFKTFSLSLDEWFKLNHSCIQLKKLATYIIYTVKKDFSHVALKIPQRIPCQKRFCYLP